MTLTRPAYEVTVENLDNPWTSTVEAGETADPDAGVWLADGLEMGWAFESQILPCQLEPETVTFAILADGIANLPTFAVGDRVAIDLVRPTDTDPIPYMRFAGRVTDADLVTVAKTDRVMLKLTATDPTAELAQFRDPNEDATFGTGSPIYFSHAFTVTRIAHARVWVHPLPAQFTYEGFQYTALNEPLIESTEKLLNAGLDPDDGFPVQRYVKDTIAWDYFPFDYLPPITSPWSYYLAQWQPALSGALPALFEYVADATDADMVTTQFVATGIPDPDGAVLLVDAEVLADAPTWGRNRTVAPNTVGVIGRSEEDPYDEMVAEYAIDQAAVDRFGVIGREPIKAHVRQGEAQEFADRYLDLYPVNSPDKWQLQTAEILTHTMDDATLDAYAPMFWTEREPTPGLMGRRVVLHNVDPDVDPTGGFSIYHIAGASFSCSGGKLTITPELVPAILPGTLGATAGPTFDGFDASAFTGATYKDQGGSTDYIDPALTFDRAKFTSL